MTVVHGRLPGADRRVQMSARLVTSLGRPITMARAGSQHVTHEVRWTTGPDGRWSIDLTPNSTVDPAGSLWAIAPRGDRRNRVYVSVPTAPSPVAVESILAPLTEVVVVDPAVQAEQARIAALENIARQAPGMVAALAAARADAAAAHVRVSELEARLAKVEAVPAVAAVIKPRP